MTAPTTLPFHVYAICAGSGPVVIGSYGSESEQRTAYALAKRRLQAGDYFSSDVRDIALGEDPEWRRNRQVMPVDIAMIFGGATDTQTVAVANPITDTNPMPSSVHEHRGSLIQKGLFQ